ncbi:MAG: 30S ribosomal protein S6 [Clostridia bacterium]|nr:30S ribosomal protein S6 [Clostridia bacterium]
MKKYELLFIVDSVLEDDKKEAAVEMVKETISADGEVENVDVWGNKKLAYPINKKNEGYYVLINFKASKDLPKELNRKLRISDSILRYLIVDKEEKK